MLIKLLPYIVGLFSALGGVALVRKYAVQGEDAAIDKALGVIKLDHPKVQAFILAHKGDIMELLAEPAKEFDKDTQAPS